jgi:hypothetical protein
LVPTQLAPVPLAAVVIAKVRLSMAEAPQVALQDPHAPHAPTQSTLLRTDAHRSTVLASRVPTTEFDLV